ncbi:TrmH family RNA methyltransferase [Schaalia sp. lx-100]|uniref:TrmH family RNA methyltransferase n=1 Tax=Schaalia sp. lx-100 TaxID=2899081 RepID=UPI001E3AB340|nr:RNA methyltransferase [Schaalia sp. lx-100]MCD4558071.1 RNA methyltransferase [Schaalia sp. lx-100]
MFITLHADSLHNPAQEIQDFLADYTSLTDVKLRSRLEPERGLYMAESTNVITRAIAAGHHPRSFLMAHRWIETLTPVIYKATGSKDGGDIPVFVAEEDVLEMLTGFHLHRGALAAMHRPELPSVSELLSSGLRTAAKPAQRIVILENLVDHTNVGAIFRSAAALNMDAVLVTPSCADPLYRRSVRVSMGTVFQVPWTRLTHWPHPTITELHSLGFTVAALALSEKSLSLDDFITSPACCDPHARLALVMGTEGDGLAQSTIAACDEVVKIPMAGGVDSLNVASASAVAFWATRHVGT